MLVRSAIVTGIIAGCGAVVFVAIASGYWWLMQSRPALDGVEYAVGLADTATIARDRQGMPTITATSRLDLARATGFVHGQERFFQMDLLRRNAAGELAALFGEAALAHDKSVRLHQFRMRARRGVQLLPDHHRAILRAYTQGVNSGLQALDAAPFEYSLLEASAEPWREADSLLTVYSMYLDLQERDGATERSRTLLRQFLPQDMYAFINAAGGEWDAPIDGSVGDNPALPKNTWPSAQMDRLNNFHTHRLGPHRLEPDGLEPKGLDPQSQQAQAAEPSLGSNNWAIAGQLTYYDSAMLANDMHLGIKVPNIWFRAHLKWRENQDVHQLLGVTLPGTPALIVGSNTRVAWGFTNSYGDWSDVIQLQLNPAGDQYLTPDGYQVFHTVTERIAVKGGAEHVLKIKQTIWGPVIAEDGAGNLLAYRWMAHDTVATNLNIIELEQASSAREVLSMAPALGIPAQNLVVADHRGNIGWAVTNNIPQRFGFSGEFVSDWSDGSKGWAGYLPKSDNPTIYNPSNGRIWTANSRVVGGAMYSAIGDGGYALGARAKQISQGLSAKTLFSETDLLAIQLDQRALFLRRWHALLLDQVLPHSSRADAPALNQALRDWSAAASVADQGYLITRQFRLAVRQLIFADLQHHLTALDGAFSLRRLHHNTEYALWAMASEQPSHLLPSAYASWQELLLQALDTALQALDNQYGSWQDVTWGQFNQVSIKHPMSAHLAGLRWLLDMPAQPQPGDTHMPRVAGNQFGASQRLVVAPGHEHRGILHMPSSQAAHPLLPYFGAEHDHWLRGRPTPLLPGATAYLLLLQPASLAPMD